MEPGCDHQYRSGLFVLIVTTRPIDIILYVQDHPMADIVMNVSVINRFWCADLPL